MHSDCNLAYLLKIDTETPEFSTVAFDEILDVFKEKSRHINL